MQSFAEKKVNLNISQYQYSESQYHHSHYTSTRRVLEQLSVLRKFPKDNLVQFHLSNLLFYLNMKFLPDNFNMSDIVRFSLAQSHILLLPVSSSPHLPNPFQNTYFNQAIRYRILFHLLI